jgi:mycothiol synthase
MSVPVRLSAPDPGDADALARFHGLVAEAERVDGQRAVNEQSMLTVGRDRGPRLLEAHIGETLAGAAVLAADGDGAAEAEFLVASEFRRRGVGGAILAHLTDSAPHGLAAWAHGDHPGAAALARRFGFRRARVLLKLAAPPRAEESPWRRTDLALSRFDAERDADDWLRLNALAFAGHPEQGSQTRDDLDARRAEPWFSPDDFLLARDAAGTLVGFCWLKVEAGEDGVEGEIYVLGVHPEHAGAGIGRSLLRAGLDRLRERRVDRVTLYVEEDNAAAVRLYRSEGFTDAAVDVQYRS